MRVSRGTGIAARGPSTCGGGRQHLPQELLLWRVFKAAGHRESVVLGGCVCWLSRSTWGLMDGLTDESLRSPAHSEGISGLVDRAEAV